MRTDKQWLIAFISHFTPTKSILTVAVMILENVLNVVIIFFFFFFFKGRVEEECNSQQAGQSLFFSELKQPFAAH